LFEVKAMTQLSTRPQLAHLTATLDELRAKGVRIDGEPEDRGFGIVATMVLPGDVKVNLYQPRHPLAIKVT